MDGLQFHFCPYRRVSSTVSKSCSGAGCSVCAISEQDFICDSQAQAVCIS